MSTAAVVAASRRAERRIVGTLREAGATGSASARPLPGLRWIESRRLGRMRAAGAVLEPEPGRYYLDEAAYAAYVSRRWRILLTIMVAILALGLGVSWLKWLG